MATKQYRLENPYRPKPRKPFLILILTGLFVMGLSWWTLSGNAGSVIGQFAFGLGFIEFAVGCWLALFNFHDGGSRDAWEEGFTAGAVDHQLHGRPSIASFPMPGNMSLNEFRQMMGLEEELPKKKKPPKHTAHGPTEVDLECAACRVAIEEVLKGV
jgi:hypothetical protein